MAAGQMKMFAVLLLSICVFHVSSSLLDPTLIGIELQKFARDALGVDEMQNYFDGLQYHKRTIKGEVITPELAVKISDKFKVRFEVAKRLKKDVEASYVRAESVKPTPQKECCKVDKSTLKYDVRFRSKVDMDNVCLKISGRAHSSLVHLDEGVFNEMRDISRTYPFIKWQYFGSEQGVLTSFPVYDDKEECDKYDPRFRPFYVETATPEAKDVVLVIDVSASMTGEKLYAAKEAAKTVLDTMNPKDQIGIVAFNTEVSTPGELGGQNRCYSERLARAIPTNIKNMKHYVDGLVPHGQTQYRLAFEKAFSLLKSSISGETSKTKKRVILFLTDGAPSDAKKELIFQTIRDRNFELNNSVAILTYGFGDADSVILEDIAKQNTQKYDIPANTSVGDITPGRYKFVQDITNLRGEMATYYNLFSLGTQLDPVVSVPYIDAFGTGLLMSITLPCFHNGEFIGVTGTDINIEDLLSDLTFFNQGQSTYAFMISNSGRTLIHPLLPAPTHAYGEPVFMDIRTLEPEKEFNEVFESLQKRITGSKSFVAKRFLPRGGTEKEGVTATEVNATYFWTPIQGIEFSLGVVVPVSHAKDEISSPPISSGYKFDYHRIDLYNPGRLCSHFGFNATKDKTLVKFAPGAFKDPYNYIGKDETKADVELLTAYMTDDTGKVTNPGLKNDIRDTVIATWKAEDLWLRDKTNLTQYLVWRYIGTTNGVFRFTPGIVEDKRYDARLRPWYYTALANTGLLALTTPYLDVGGAGVVITAGRAFYRGEPSHIHHTNDEVLGVMGADFPLTYFHRLLCDVYPRCKETKTYSCFVMDSAGFLIMHEDFLLPSATASDLQYVHITEKEKNIAEDLIKNKYLIKKQCRHLEEIQKQSFYEVSLPVGGVDSLRSGARCSKYQLGRILGTNAYIGVAVRDSFCPPETCSCSSDNTCSLFNLACECPCTSPLEFHYCRSLFPASSLPICPPSAPNVQPINDPAPPVPCKSGLEKCFIPHCSERKSLQACEGVVGCYWCENDKDDVPLKKPYCASAEVCFRGKEVERKICPTGDPQTTTLRPTYQANSTKAKLGGDDEPHQMSPGAIAGIVIGCLAGVAVTAIASFLIIRHFRTFNEAQPKEDAENPDDTPLDVMKRPPAPLPPNPETPRPEEDYEDPDKLQRSRQASVTSIQWPSPYDEIRVRVSDDKPPALPPDRKKSTVTAPNIQRLTSLPLSLPEERRKSAGDLQPSVTQNRRIPAPSRFGPLRMHSVDSSVLEGGRTKSTGDSRPSVAKNRTTPTASRAEPIRPHYVENGLPEIPEKRRVSVLSPPSPISEEKTSTEDEPQTLTSDNKQPERPPTPDSDDKGERPYGNVPLQIPEQSSSLDTSSMSSGDVTAEQGYLHRPTLPQRESVDSIVLDPHGYIEFAAENKALDSD